MPSQKESSSQGGNLQNSTPEPDQKRRKTLEKAKVLHLSRQLQLRLKYARLKVDHGWQKQNLNEVENLYFRHAHMHLRTHLNRPLSPFSSTSTTIGSASPHKFLFQASEGQNPSNVASDVTIGDASEATISPQLTRAVSSATPMAGLLVSYDLDPLSDDIHTLVRYPAFSEPSMSPSPTKKRKRIHGPGAQDPPSPTPSSVDKRTAGARMRLLNSKTAPILQSLSSPSPSPTAHVGATMSPMDTEDADASMLDPTFNTFTHSRKIKTARVETPLLESPQKRSLVTPYSALPPRMSGASTSPSPFANSTLTYDTFWSIHGSGRSLVSSPSVNGAGSGSLAGLSGNGSSNNIGTTEND